MERVKAAMRRKRDKAYWCANRNRNMKLKNLHLACQQRMSCRKWIQSESRQDRRDVMMLQPVMQSGQERVHLSHVLAPLTSGQQAAKK